MATVLQDGRLAKSGFSEAEWRVRVELAAFYRLAALHGWDDLIFTHITARVPGPEHHFLINPYGLMFEEITASSLVKIDLEGNVSMTANMGSIMPAMSFIAQCTPRFPTLCLSPIFIPMMA